MKKIILSAIAVMLSFTSHAEANEVSTVEEIDAMQTAKVKLYLPKKSRKIELKMPELNVLRINDYEFVVHYCNMKTVYVSKEIRVKRKVYNSNSLAIVWDHDKGAPLKCSDYKEYVKSNYQD